MGVKITDAIVAKAILVGVGGGGAVIFSIVPFRK